jgi:phosphotransferase system  glucose/maltose/N-acetylglucosamine-specific IIC component
MFRSPWPLRVVQVFLLAFAIWWLFMRSVAGSAFFAVGLIGIVAAEGWWQRRKRSVPSKSH